jgi:signal transduction histidine kinase
VSTVTEADPRLHGWAGSIRFRLTVLYSVLLFGLATVVVGGIYAGVARGLERQQVSRTEEWIALFPGASGQPELASVEIEVPDYLLLFERAVNEQALDQLRTYAFGALGLLFIGSLCVGWFVAGIVLRPVGRITGVAKEIEATDLSRRIDLDGPDDELKQLADTFDGMLERIDDAFESQREFIHEASHELRNPLAVIRTNIDVALDDPDATNDELRSVGDVVGRSAERMSTLVDDLLLYARHGTRQTRTEDVDIVGEVEEVVEEFGAAADANGVTLVADLPEMTLPVRGDGQAIHRAAANLVANAVRLAPRDSTVTVAGADEGRWVTLSVADEGPGIGPEDQLRVFQRFWRGDKEEARTAGRSGLGLTIVRQIAEAHGGRIELESTLGEGSRFTLRFPRR